VFIEGEIPMKLRLACVVFGFLSLASLAAAQTSAQAASALPRLVRFSGAVKDLNGNPLTGVVGITFALYSEQSGGAPLWLETQNITADSNGHYTVLLGSTKPDGLPAELFTSEQARWVGVQVSGQPEQPRVLLVSAPYALKAGDAETIGGLPPSAFVLAAPSVIGSSSASGTAGTVSPLAATDVTTNGGTLNYLPIFSGAATIIDSSVFQTGSGTTGKIGIDTTTPATQLDVNGAGTIRGTLTLPATGTATATAGDVSRGLNFVASSYNSTSATAVNQTFRWHAEPAANDTASPSGTLNLLYGVGTAAPSETGLKLSSKGVFTFASGQTFPGTGTGTITGITTASGSGLAGGGTTGTLSLKVPAAGITNAMLANSRVTLNSGTGIKAPGAMTLGDTYTVGINTAVVPQLAAANTFTNLQTINAGSSTSPALNITNASGTGIVISAPSSIFGYGVDAQAGGYGVYANGGSYGGYFKGAGGGTYSENDTDSDGAVAAYAYEYGTTKQDFGFWGYSASTHGVGVYGQAVQASGTAEGFNVGARGGTTPGILLALPFSRRRTTVIVCLAITTALPGQLRSL
jgi:hypothetical protein